MVENWIDDEIATISLLHLSPPGETAKITLKKKLRVSLREEIEVQAGSCSKQVINQYKCLPLNPPMSLTLLI